MSAPEKPIINLADVPLREFGKGDKFAAKLGRIGPMLGSTGIGCTLTVVPPGKRAFPFHRHHVIHELFFVLAKSEELSKTSDGTFDVTVGPVVQLWRLARDMPAP